MFKWLRRLFWILLIVLPAYWALVLHSPAPTGSFALDIGKLRTLANSLPGSKPTEIRYEQITAFEFAKAMVTAGEPWEATPIPVYSYQLVFPGKTIIVDAAMDRSLAKPEFMVPMFDDAAYLRMSKAMEQAAQIVITHEHLDHIGGIARHPNLSALLPALRLTAEQLSHPDRMKPAELPAGPMQSYLPLRYEGLHVLAPGVVLIKSPGHTPGSQMVYVQRADGRELILLGDVSWQMRNIELVRERPLFMTLMVKEDRQQVLAQFAALNQLMKHEPAVKLVPGHDGKVVKALTEAGLLTAGFRI